MEVYFQGELKHDSFKITNIGYLDKRINRIKKIRRYKMFVRRRKFKIRKVKYGFLLINRGIVIGKIVKCKYKRGWWKLEL